jgi:hypothetical protein
MFGTTLPGCSDPGKEPKAQGSTQSPKEPTPKEKVAKWQKEAEAGNADAQNSLGYAYDRGEGVPKDATKAVEWYQKAAAQGLAVAQARLGFMYRKGEGVPKDAAKAFEWYQKAALQGHAGAQAAVGAMYQEGEGVIEDLAKGLDWYQKAASQGDAVAQTNVGAIYLLGVGVPKDAAKGFEWYQKSAAQGRAGAQATLGALYYGGEGVPKDFAKAFEWYQKAAAQGYSAAQSELGAMYYSGEGVSRDIVLGYVWANLSAAQGNKEGIARRDWIEERLTPAQRTEGQRLASNWKKGEILKREPGGGAVSSNESSGGAPAKRGSGTAFSVSTAGHVLTNHHVVEDCKEVKVAGRDGIGKVITSDRVNDLALLQLPTQTQDAAPITAEPSNLRQGEDIVTYGFPLNSVLSAGGNLTPGTVSALTGLGNNTNQIQITAPIQPGSSGSPVLDKKGQVVGIVSTKLSDSRTAKATGSLPQNVNFAVSGQTIRAFLDANKVQYKSGAGYFAREKSNADLAEEARKWTVLLECWK